MLGSLVKQRGWALSALLAAVLGCGGSSEPKIPDSARLLLDAQKAIAAGDNAAALTALQASIDAEPTTWAYLERAKLNGKQGNDQAVEQDCVEVLKIDPQNKDVPWLRAELKKPASARFAPGNDPPSTKK